jgi:acetyltransferase-like isoleucine patch superfamily enzyme
MKEMKERSHNSAAGLWKGFLGHWAYYTHWPHTLAALLHKIRGVKISHVYRVRIAGNVLIDTLYPELVEIEDDVFITRGATIVAHFTPTPFMRKYIPEVEFGKVVIKRGAYVGVNAIVLPGVTIGEGAIIGAGSVVTKDVPPLSVAVGNPARVIRTVGGREGVS